MSQLPKITIANLLQFQVGWLEARIKAIEVYPVASKYANPPNSTVNVYKLTLLDNTGSIEYSDWCKKPGITRTYKVGQILRFAHAKLKVSKNINPDTGVVYPPAVTNEAKTIVELYNENNSAIIPRTNQGTTPVAATAPTMPVATGSLPASIPTIPQAQTTATAGIPTTIVAPQPDYLVVQDQFPVFYNAVNVLLNKLYEALTTEQKVFVDLNYSEMMDIIWGVKP